MNKSAFASRLRAARKAAGYTQAELAEYANVSNGAAPAISNMENGKHFPSLPTLFRLCKVLRVSANWLMGLNYENTVPNREEGD
jgi:transcriptional regulator with XRE-family HTH domain